MMNNYFDKFKEIKDNNNPFTYHYVIDDGVDFYVERVFYTKLKNLFFIHKDKVDIVLDEMIRLVNKNKHVVFVGDFEFIQTEVDDTYIYLEIEDVLNPLNIYVEDKSRGSDYGD